MKISWLLVALSFQVARGQEEESTTPPPFQPPPKPEGDVYFAESFSDEEGAWKVWIRSEAKKDGAEPKYDGNWKIEALATEGAIEEDEGLVLPEAAKHYAIAAKLDKPFDFENAEAFVIQYEVNFQNGLSCGGAYVKLVTSTNEDLEKFHDATPYSIMFGPDKCGQSSKIHFIIRYKNPVTGEIEEKHSKQSTETMNFFDDKKTHLFTLLIRSDGVYHVIVDQKPFFKGSLLEDMTPPIVPLKEIDDPEDRMPEDWDEREKIADPDAVKPDDWDEDAPAKITDPDAVKPEGWLDEGPEYIPDPDATMPEDWDEEEDGEYEPPQIPNPVCEKVGCGEWRPAMIPNPAYKGKWKPDLIANPDYDGKWAPRKIPNPGYFEEDTPFDNLLPVEAVGFELWTMSEGIFIDNVIVCGELVIANNYARDGWIVKMEKERKAGGAMDLGSWLDWYVELANTYPYLWALYAIAIVLPFVICIGCCCIKSKKSEDETARRKKTDEPSPDDAQRVEEDEPPPELVPVEQEKDSTSFIAAAEDEQEEEARKSPVENLSQGEESEGEAGARGGDGSQGEDEDEVDVERSQEEEEEEEEEKEEEKEETKVETSPSKKTRKRKPRRED